MILAIASIRLPAMSSDLTFITNEGERSLGNRFQTLLKGHTRFFDCLVGYFYVSGFFKIHSSLEATEKIRILIGISTNKSSHDLMGQAKQEELNLFSHAEAKEIIPPNLQKELETSEDSVEMEEGVFRFVEWIRSGKLEIRAYPSEKIHAKVYVMTFVDGHIDKGRVITGSSNFTQAGFQDNLEFNVELKNRSDYEFALQKFNELWAQGVDVSETHVQTIERKSPLAHFTPYELYLKFLYEYFRTEINRPENLEENDLPSGFKKLKYQEEAVLSAKRILEEYNGVFLSDVVGLGKTYMSAMLAKELGGKILVIAPPSVLDKSNPGSWWNVFRDFSVPHADFESIGKLDDLLEGDLSRYTTVFIDESHRFRTEDTQTYEKLAQICRGKRVVLVSATPYNNYPKDVLSQIKLFQPGKNSTLPNLRNLEDFFSRLDKKLKNLDRKDPEYTSIVRENAKEMREKVLKYLMIRRTRREIEKFYAEDLKEQKLKFPDVLDPEPLYYQFDPTESEVFTTTTQGLIQQFKYSRYQPYGYFKNPPKEFELQSQINLAKFMKTLLVKRLESSFHAFRLTLDRFVTSYERFISEYNKGNVYLSKKHMHKIFDALEAEDEETVQKLLGQDKAVKFSSEDFKPEFIQDLKHDLHLLETLREQWKRVKRDPKWIAFRHLLESRTEFQKEKLLIFTESSETAEYLAQKIREHVEPKTVHFCGQSEDALREQIIANFDAKAPSPKEDYRILVTTDVLAEGVNLHRSRIVINYDIPWNPTRLMQRVGRVNRVGTAFDSILTFNFFPTDESDLLLNLKSAAENKIHAFIEMLGNDAKLLTQNEEIKSHELFGQLNSKKILTGEDETEESELEYLSEIRKIRDEQPELFERIKRLPKKARSTRDGNALSLTSSTTLPALLNYFRKGRLDKFFLACKANREPANPESLELDFFTTAKILKPTNPKETRQAIPQEFYALLAQNKEAFGQVTSEEQFGKSKRPGRSNDTYLIRRLKDPAIRHCKAYTEEDEHFVKRVLKQLEDGQLPQHTSKKTSQALKTEIEPLKVLSILRKNIPSIFLESRSEISHTESKTTREVILSSWMTRA